MVAAAMADRSHASNNAIEIAVFATAVVPHVTPRFPAPNDSARLPKLRFGAVEGAGKI